MVGLEAPKHFLALRLCEPQTHGPENPWTWEDGKTTGGL